MKHWPRLIGYGLTAGSFLKLSIAMAPAGIVQGMPLGAISFPLFGLASLALCPIIVFFNRNRPLRTDDGSKRPLGWYRWVILALGLVLAIAPIVLGYRHLWWLGLLCPLAAVEATLSPQKPFDAIDLFDALINKIAGRAPQS